jgi:hypothetical protein
MSGGAFSYDQFKIRVIAETIESIIANNGKEKIPEDRWSEYDTHYSHYSDETIEEFKKAVEILKKGEVYTQRIDWLLSGDDGEETFHERLKKDLKKLGD